VVCAPHLYARFGCLVVMELAFRGVELVWKGNIVR
jgi:hypothetical protein